MRLITIGRSRQFETAVSDVDYDYLMQWLWTFAVSHQGGELIYARRSIRVDGRNVTVLMHRVIVLLRKRLLQPTPEHTVDHRDGDSLNNQRGNLKWATPKEQMANRMHIHRTWAKVVDRDAITAAAEIPF